MDPVRSLAGVRLAIGAGAWVAPRLAGKAFAIRMDENAQGPYLARLFGVRDVALAAGALTTEGEAQRTWLVAGLACDLADAAAALLSRRRDELGGVTTVLGAGAALTAAALGAAALSR